MRLNQRIRGLIAGMIVSIVFVSGCSGPSEIAVTSFVHSEGNAESDPPGFENSDADKGSDSFGTFGSMADEDSAGSISPEETAVEDGKSSGTADDAGKSSGTADDADSVSPRQLQSEAQEDVQMLAVYVCGAVQEPDVYYLPVGARIYDALQAAGGFTEDADSQWLNQAQLLADGQMLLVYTAQETAQMELQGAKRGGNASGTVSSGPVSGGAASSGSSSTDSSIVNLNTGTKEQLMTLPGIGESKADAIIRYRTETGMFGCAEDIMNISGIKNSTFEKIKDRITV